MNYPSYYQELLADGSLGSHPSLLVRQGNVGLSHFQFSDSRSVEHIAVQGEDAYGVRTQESFGAESSDLLAGEFKGADYAVYEVPYRTESLRSLSLGRRVYPSERQLVPTYRRIGSIIGERAKQFMIPNLEVNDIAVDLKGDVLFVPRLEFADGSSSAESLIEALVLSVQECFEDRYSADGVLHLVDALFEGLDTQVG